MIPFRSSLAAPRLPEGYALLQPSQGEHGWASPERIDRLNRLLQGCGDSPRPFDRWQRVLERSAWHLGVEDPEGRLVGFVRATSDQALNANLWDLIADLGDPAHEQVLNALVRVALGRLRRELGGCSISLSAPPEALEIVSRAGFVVDPGGIRAMGLVLRRS